MTRLIIITTIGVVIIGPPLLLGFALCRAAARGDAAAEQWLIDADVCPGCDGFLEFDDDGSNLCSSCGSSWPSHYRINQQGEQP